MVAYQELRHKYVTWRGRACSSPTAIGSTCRCRSGRPTRHALDDMVTRLAHQVDIM
jgi:hypothetical protein